MVKYNCNECGKEFSQKSNWIQHTQFKKYPCISKLILKKEFHDIPIQNNQNFVQENIYNINPNNDQNLENKIENKINQCEFCGKTFSNIGNANKHIKNNCKIKKKKDEEKINQLNNMNELFDFNKQLILQNNEIKKQNEELKNDLLKLSIKQIPKICTNIKKLEQTIPANSNFELSNQLVNKIIEKEKKIDELDKELNEFIKEDSNKQQIKNNIIIVNDINNIIDNKYNNITDNKYNCIDEFNNFEESDVSPMNLILNNQLIQFRESDNYINATQLCKAGEKNFTHWNSLESTKKIINTLATNTKIPILDLIDKKVCGNHINIWIHPDLAIQLAQWLNPNFALEISSRIRELFTKGNSNKNLKILKEKENIIKDCKRRIKILENLTLKRHSRTKYPDSNVVYIITDDKNKKERKYIIGSTTDLTKRLSSLFINKKFHYV
jgi:DNA-directed RNA polymerase subunit RPC12/RpoP